MAKNPPSLRLRQNANQSQAPLKRNKELLKKSIAQPAQKKVEQDTGSLIYPGGDTAFKALLSARFCAAIWSHITDCDETYNYWEPTHYLIFGKGLQTWEYSPEFALRSYSYLLLFATPAYIYHQILQPNPMLIFYFIRCVFGLICAYCEVLFYKAVCREFGVHVGRLCLTFQIFSTGMFIASTAYLPSSWAMYAFLSACAAWWQQKFPLAIFSTGLGAILGWPFAALLGAPIAFDMLYIRKLYKDFFQWSMITAVILLTHMIVTDTSYYGKLVIAPWNIVKYNVLGGPGSELYGTEPFSYYIVNGFLNFNIVWVLTLLTPIALLAAYFFVPAKRKSTLTLPYVLSLSPLYLWLAVFLIQPHKEERFLFPIYPMICLCGAITVDILQKLWFRVLNALKSTSLNLVYIPDGAHYLDFGKFIMIGALVISSVMGLSRSFSLYKNYHAPLDLMMELNQFSYEGKLKDGSINVCFGKDWYRFPSSFFLPNKNWNVRFIQSDFKGMLPAPYSEFSNGTTIVHKHFNNLNQEEPSLYFDINKCHFLLDLDLNKASDLEPIYAKQYDKWTVIKTLPFLNAENSNPFFRAFYIPFVTSRYVKFGRFSLLKNSKLGKLI